MRVISGTARRLQLDVAPDSMARPFLEKARGALFNSLCQYIGGARVLDLFAGSGALGIEALSRGAESCEFIEKDRASAEVIRNNLKKCRLEDGAMVICGAVESSLRTLSGEYDLVFIDPPFPMAEKWTDNPVGRIVIESTAELLAEGGRLVFRFEQFKAEAPQWCGVPMIWDRRYGRSRVCVYAK